MRCLTAEPLTAPTKSETVQLTGQAWPDFDHGKVMTMAPTAAPVGSFDVKFVGASNVEGGTIAAGSFCVVGSDCPAPGPGQVPNDYAFTAGLVAPAPPAQCAAASDEKVGFSIVNLKTENIVLSWVDLDTCATHAESAWSYVIPPGQRYVGTGSIGSLGQVGNGADTTPLASIEITESLSYAVK